MESSSHSITSINCELGLSRSSIPIFEPHSKQDSKPEEIIPRRVYERKLRPFLRITSRAVSPPAMSIKLSQNDAGTAGNKALVILIHQGIDDN